MKASLRFHRRIGGSRLVSFLAVTFGFFGLLVRAHVADRNSAATSGSSEWPFLFLPASSPTTLLSSLFHAEKEAAGEGRHLKATGSPADSSLPTPSKGSGESEPSNLSPQPERTMTTSTVTSPDDKAEQPEEAAEPGLPAHHPLYRMPSQIVATDAQAFVFPFWKQPAPKPALPPSPPNVLNAPASVSSSPAFMAWFGMHSGAGNDSRSPSEELSESLQTTIVGGGGQGSADGSMPSGLQRDWFGTRQPYKKESFPSFFSWIWKGGSSDKAETSLSSLFSQEHNDSQADLTNVEHENSSFPWGFWKSKEVPLPEQLRQRAALLSAFASTWWFGSSSSSSSSPVGSLVDGVKKASHKTGEAFREASRAIGDSSPSGFSSEISAGPALATQGGQLLSPAIAAVKAAAWWFSEREKEIEDAAKDLVSGSSTKGSSSMSSLLLQQQQAWLLGNRPENGDREHTIIKTAEVDGDSSMKDQVLSSLENAAQWFGHQKTTLENLDVSKANSWFSGLQALRETAPAESYVWSGSERDDGTVVSSSQRKENNEKPPSSKTEETSRKHFFPPSWFQQWFWGGETTDDDDDGDHNGEEDPNQEKRTRSLALFDPAQIFAIPTKTAIWWSQQEARAPEAVTFFWSLRASEKERESGDVHRNLHEASGPLRKLSDISQASRSDGVSDLVPPPPAASAAAAAAASWLWSQKASREDQEGYKGGRSLSSSSSSPSPLESTLAWFWEKQKEDAEQDMSTWFGRQEFLPGASRKDAATMKSSSSSSFSPRSWLFGQAHRAQSHIGDSLKQSLADWFGQWTEATKRNAEDAVAQAQDKALNKLNEKTAGVQKKASKAAKAGFSAWFWGSSDPVKNTVQTGKAVVKSLTEDGKKTKSTEEEGGESGEKKSHSLAGQLKSLVFGDSKGKNQDEKKEDVRSSSEAVSPASATSASTWWSGEGKEAADSSSMASSWFTRGAGGQAERSVGKNFPEASASFTGSWFGSPSEDSSSYGGSNSPSVASKVSSWFGREKKEEKPSSPWNFFSRDHHGGGAFFGSSETSQEESSGKSLSGWGWGRSSQDHDDLKEEKDSKDSHSHGFSWFPTINHPHKETHSAPSPSSSPSIWQTSEGGKTSQEHGLFSTGKDSQEGDMTTDRQGKQHLERVRPSSGSSSSSTSAQDSAIAGDSHSPQPGGGLMEAWNWSSYGGYRGGGQSHPIPEEGPTVRRSGSFWGGVSPSSSSMNGVPSLSSSSSVSASLFDWESEENQKEATSSSSPSSSLFDKMSHVLSRSDEAKVSTEEASPPPGANIPTQLIAKHAAQAAGWFGISGDNETSHPVRAPGLKRGSYWWEWQANSDGTTSVTTTPPYTRHVHLDCDPTPPFRDCVVKCQAENQSKPSSGGMSNNAAAAEEERRRRRTGEPSALGSYEYSNLRSCYMTCRQKWIDADLPGCLRQDGTKVEGVPPVEAFRTTTTTTPPTTTVPRPRAHTSYPQGSPWEREDENNKESSSFWSRMTGGKTPEEKPTETHPPEEHKGFFSIFRGASDTTTTTPPPSREEEETHGLSKLLGILKGGRKTQETTSTEGPSPSRFPFSLLGGTSGNGGGSQSASEHHSSSSSSSSSSLFSGWSSASTGETYLNGSELLLPSASLSLASEQVQEDHNHKDEENHEKGLPSVSSFGISLWPSSSSFSKTSGEPSDKKGVVSSEAQQQISFPFNLLNKDSQETAATPSPSEGNLSTEVKEKKTGREGRGWWMTGVPGRATSSSSSLSLSSTDDKNDSLIDKTLKAVKEGVTKKSSEDGGVGLGEETKKSIEAVKEVAEEAGKETTHAILNWWPVLLLIVGIGLLLISLVGRRFGQWEGMAGSGDLERGEYAGAPAFRSIDSSRKSQIHSRSSLHTTMQASDTSNNYDDHKQPLISNEGE